MSSHASSKQCIIGDLNWYWLSSNYNELQKLCLELNWHQLISGLTIPNKTTINIHPYQSVHLDSKSKFYQKKIHFHHFSEHYFFIICMKLIWRNSMLLFLVFIYLPLHIIMYVFYDSDTILYLILYVISKSSPVELESDFDAFQISLISQPQDTCIPLQGSQIKNI